MSDPEAIPTRRVRGTFALLLTSLLVGATIDLATDRPTSWRSVHVVVDALTIAIALVGATAFWSGWRRSSKRAGELAWLLRATREERDRWRENTDALLHSVGRVIDDQFDRWRLTPAERAVALQLLAGLGHKHIADATHRSERTVRQLASQVYEKAGLHGRAELAAYFLRHLVRASLLSM